MGTPPSTIVVGGGIAGLSIAWQLAKDGARAVTLLEREAMVGTHSSARNAQIWLPTDDDETTGPLARRTAALMTALAGGEATWLRRGDAIVIVPDDAHVASIERGAARGQLRARRASADELHEKSPLVRRDRAKEPALVVEGAGIFDPHAMISALERACRAARVRVETGATARSLLGTDRVRGVLLEDGRELSADEVVVAGGAWARELGASAGADVPLVALRRHLVLLEADPRRAGTTVWRFGDRQVYYRPESGGVLASPCDEEPSEPGLPPSDPAALEALAEALEPIAPELVEARVRTKWACLRTYAHDRELVLGPDPRVEGLAWMAGFGGRGMTVALGAAELCAAAMRGEASELLALTRPDRAQPPSLLPPSC
ncbi:MAG: FAD-binding oxidoreductase [Sandaracinaceae bacterium]|nr:FAD-binding oxidoreductase [Sandaracinaceae bacterium]